MVISKIIRIFVVRNNNNTLKNMKKVVILPKYIETIIVDNSNKDNVKALAHTPYKFDKDGECELTMEFYDGIAYDVNGTGLVMTYPTQEKVQKHSILQNCIVSYATIYEDENISQYDIAMRYGKLEWKPENANSKHIHFDSHEFKSFTETLATLSGDIYNKVYSIKGDYVETAATIRDLAVKFEDWWNREADDDTDFIFALEDFEKKELEALGYKKPELTDEDFDDEPENEDFVSLIVKAANDITKASLKITEQFSK